MQTRRGLHRDKAHGDIEPIEYAGRVSRGLRACGYLSLTITAETRACRFNRITTAAALHFALHKCHYRQTSEEETRIS